MANFANFAYGLVRTPPSPSTTGTTIVLDAGHGARMPPVPFYATVWPLAAMPDPTNAEIITVFERDGDILPNVARGIQGSTPRAIVAGDQFAATVTKSYLDVVPLTTDPLVTFQHHVVVSQNLSVLGQAFFSSVGVVGGVLEVQSGIDIDGHTAIDGDLDVTGHATIGRNVDVVGTGYFTSNVVIGGTLFCQAYVVQPRIRGYGEVWQSAGISSGTVAFDYADGNHVMVNLTENVTGITVTNIFPYGIICPVMFYYTAGGGPRTVVHTINGHAVRWAGGVAPVMGTSAGQVDRFLYTTWDGGVSWLGDIIGAY